VSRDVRFVERQGPLYLETVGADKNIDHNSQPHQDNNADIPMDEATSDSLTDSEPDDDSSSQDTHSQDDGDDSSNETNGQETDEESTTETDNDRQEDSDATADEPSEPAIQQLRRSTRI